MNSLERRLGQLRNVFGKHTEVDVRLRLRRQGILLLSVHRSDFKVSGELAEDDDFDDPDEEEPSHKSIAEQRREQKGEQLPKKPRIQYIG